MDTDLSNLDKSPLRILEMIAKLKDLPREGWRRTVENPESVAAHSFGLAMLVILFAPAHLDKSRCILIALCHDLAESVVGDIPTYAGVSKERKHKEEELAFHYLVSLIAPRNPQVAEDVMTAWTDYEEGQSPEAKFVKEMDKFECLHQAGVYEKRVEVPGDLEEFQGLRNQIHSPPGTNLLEQYQQGRVAWFSKRRRRLSVIFITGDPSVCEAQGALLSKEFGFQHIPLEKLLVKKSNDQSYRHAGILKEYLKERVDAPVDMVIGLLEREIQGSRGGKGWSLISGFPQSTGQLIEYEREVQPSTYTLLLKRQKVESRGHLRAVDEEPQVYRPRGSDLETYLRSRDHFFAVVHCGGSEQDDYDLVKPEIERFMEHNKGEEENTAIVEAFDAEGA